MADDLQEIIRYKSQWTELVEHQWLCDDYQT